MKTKPELIAPVGNLDCARAAVANGADAVYFGLPQFNARMRADNFTAGQLPELVGFLHQHGVRAYAVLNVLIFTDELPGVERHLLELDRAGVDAVIVQDLGVARLAQKLGLRAEIHASTQMTITSPEGLRLVERLGIRRVILARELSLRELAKFRSDAAEGSDQPGLEVFVHGALCVAYSGQCLTSEALGQRSANRGECAQACRLPYELVVDGVTRDLGERRYLLSPQDLAAVREIPELMRLGVAGFKIEGRLKSPEYVAATTQVYRKAIDTAAGAQNPVPVSDEDWYKLEMTFSRGLYSGWLHGVNHQELVPGRYGKKRGPLAGMVRQVGQDHVELNSPIPLRPGDGIVFDTGGDPEREQGGRIYEIKGDQLYFEYGQIDFARLKPGDRVWKTSDPQLERALRKSYRRPIPLPKMPVDLQVTGECDRYLVIEATTSAGVRARVVSAMPLQTAFKRPLTAKVLQDQLGRLGETRFVLRHLHNGLVGQVILPVSELNRLRRELVSQLETGESPSIPEGAPAPLTGVGALPQPALANLLAAAGHQCAAAPQSAPVEKAVLCRTMEQLEVALEGGWTTLYADFEDPRRYRDAVALVRDRSSPLAPRPSVVLATPRIQKAGERGFFKLIEDCQPDGVLIRNLGALEHFRDSALQRIGDFSLNVANPISAALLIEEGLERVTVSYDLNAEQVVELLQAAPSEWFEITLHQHLPLFHMEHCVFAAFLSNGTDAANCGRPCDRHRLRLRDRVGLEHPVQADVGCRNTVFHARAQSGADFLRTFRDAGARRFRVEFLDEDAATARALLHLYGQLLDGGPADGGALWRRWNVARQLGVTAGTLTVLG